LSNEQDAEREKDAARKRIVASNETGVFNEN